MWTGSVLMLRRVIGEYLAILALKWIEEKPAGEHTQHTQNIALILIISARVCLLITPKIHCTTIIKSEK